MKFLRWIRSLFSYQTRITQVQIAGKNSVCIQSNETIHLSNGMRSGS